MTVDPHSHELLRLLVSLQEREHRALAERLHDGPMQDFTAVLLELASVRRQLGGTRADLAARITAIEAHLRGTVTSLHLAPSAFRLGNDARRVLEVGFAHRVSGLLVEQIDVDIDVTDHPPGPGDLAVTLAAVQLLLQASNPHGIGEHATVLVRSTAGGLDLRLSVRPRDCEPSADAARMSRLRPLAELIGVELCHDPGAETWDAHLHLAPAAADRGHPSGG